MSQFDVFENTNRATKMRYSYLLDIQSDLLSDLRTTVVIPLSLVEESLGSPIKGLNPVFEILGGLYMSMPTLIAGIDRSVLGKKICNLEVHRDEIISAVDLMITGI